MITQVIQSVIRFSESLSQGFLAGIGALGLRNWARYNLIVLAFIEMPAIVLSLLTPVLLWLPGCTQRIESG